jgi:SAM-dependent methyltransferase
MELYEYKYNDEMFKWMMEQQWEAREHGVEYYHKLSVFEFEQIEKFLGNPKKVLEVGCGIGRSSVFVNHLLKDDSVEYVLADRHGFPKQNTGAFAPSEDEYYCDLDQTLAFAKLNGINNASTFDTELSDWNSLKNVDLIFSTCSFGMHVPIERYIDRMIATCNSGATMIFGTRQPHYGPNSFANLFEEVIFQPGLNGIPYFATENWLVLKNPKQF